MRAGRRWNRNKLLAARTFRSIRCASLRPSPKFRGHDTQLLAFLVWSSWMTRMRMFFLIAVAAVCMLAAWEYLNFTGFCYGQHRYLSDQEMIDAAVLYEINTNARYHVQDVRDNPGWTKNMRRSPNSTRRIRIVVLSGGGAFLEIMERVFGSGLLDGTSPGWTSNFERETRAKNNSIPLLYRSTNAER
jgi:hypothetical protein